MTHFQNAMTKTLSVNAALSALPTLEGHDVQINGILHFGFEDVALYHYPKRERNDGYRSSIWLDVGNGSPGFNREICSRLDGKRVTVQGSLHGPDLGFDGCGHMSLWPAVLLARTLERT